MASIPLPELSGNPPQQTDLLGQYGKVAALKNMIQTQQYQQQMQPLQLQQEQQAVQVQAQQLKDQQAAQQAYGQWDGKDYDALAKGVIQHGGSAAAANQIAMFGINQRKGIADIYKSENEGAKAQADATKISNDQKAGAINAALDQPDAQLNQSALSTAQRLLNDKTINQAEYNTVTQLAQQLPPDQLRTQLGNLAKSYTAESEQYANAKSQAETGKAQAEKATIEAERPGKIATSDEQVATMQAYHQWAGSQKPGVDTSIGAYKAYQAGITAKAEAGGRLGAEEGLAKFQFNLQQGMLPDELKTVAPHLVPAAAAQYEKASTDYLGAKQGADDMQTIINLARESGNKIAYSYAPVTGVLTINTAHGVKRVNMAEIGSYGGAGSAWDRVQSWFGKQATGASIDSSVLNDMEQAHAALNQNAQNNYNNRVNTINYTYRSKFQPQQPTTAPGAERSSGAAPSPSTGGGNMVSVQIPGQPPGQIPSSQLKAFQQKHPDASVLGQQ